MNMLPKWVLPSYLPSVYDSESGTVLEMTAKLYGAMNTLISEYNTFADTVNEQMEGFSSEEKEARKEFELSITKVMNEFRCCMEQYMKTNLNATAEKLIGDALASGQIIVTEHYDPVTESLDIVAGGDV